MNCFSFSLCSASTGSDLMDELWLPNSLCAPCLMDAAAMLLPIESHVEAASFDI